MELTYKNDKLQKMCESTEYHKELVKKYGIEVANKLPRRIMELKSFNSLGDVPSVPPYRRHKLSGNLKNCYAINITSQYRFKRNKENRNSGGV